MAGELSDLTVPYEILIRFGEDGSFQAAHQQRRRILKVDGEVVKDIVLPAEPLAGEAFIAAIGEAAAAAIATGEEALARLNYAQTQIEALEDQVVTLTARAGDADQLASRLQAELVAAQIAQMVAERDRAP